MLTSVTMPWGKFKGVPLSKIESSYLCWCLESADQVRPTLRAAIKEELHQRFGPPPPPPSSFRRKPCPDPSLAEDLVSAGLRSLAKKLHPDTGGDTSQMQLANACADWLKTQVSR